MQITPLTLEEAGNCGFNQKITLTYADIILLTSATAASVYPDFNNASTFAAGSYVAGAALVVKTPFTGGTGTLTLQLGDGTTANKFIAATDLTTVQYAGFNSTLPVMFNAAGAVKATVTAGTGITGWTAGEVDIYLDIVPMQLLNR